jgi:hypothetical protein
MISDLVDEFVTCTVIGADAVTFSLDDTVATMPWMLSTLMAQLLSMPFCPTPDGQALL